MGAMCRASWARRGAAAVNIQRQRPSSPRNTARCSGSRCRGGIGVEEAKWAVLACCWGGGGGHCRRLPKRDSPSPDAAPLLLARKGFACCNAAMWRQEARAPDHGGAKRQPPGEVHLERPLSTGTTPLPHLAIPGSGIVCQAPAASPPLPPQQPARFQPAAPRPRWARWVQCRLNLRVAPCLPNTHIHCQRTQQSLHPTLRAPSGPARRHSTPAPPRAAPTASTPPQEHPDTLQLWAA